MNLTLNLVRHHAIAVERLDSVHSIAAAIAAPIAIAVAIGWHFVVAVVNYLQARRNHFKEFGCLQGTEDINQTKKENETYEKPIAGNNQYSVGLDTDDLPPRNCSLLPVANRFEFEQIDCG